jgi:hypothetical protein
MGHTTVQDSGERELPEANLKSFHQEHLDPLSKMFL